MNINQGASRSTYAEMGACLYETVPCAIHALMRAEHLPPNIWEPCAGRGAISRELKKVGHNVVSTELYQYDHQDEYITTGVDFLKVCQGPFSEDIPSAIVTNPPFRHADEFIRHGLSLGHKIYVLLRLMYIEGKSRSDIIDRHLERVWAGIERLPTMHRDGWDGPKLKQSAVPYGWFVFTPLARPVGTPVELRRISWRESSWPMQNQP